MFKRIISLLIVLIFGFESTGFAQVAVQLDISARVSAGLSNIIQDKFRPIHLRYLEFNPTQENFKLLLDKGSVKNPNQQLVDETTKELLKYFLIGVSLPNDAFWVNLRPDASNEIIDENLAKTDVGKILLEADLQLKKDTAKYTSPQTLEGKEYWNKLYQKAEELYGNSQTTIPTLNRPWIVPDEIIVRENQGSAYIYKATLKVMLEGDYLKGSQTYNFTDEKAKALNEYSSQLLKETIIPKITKEINSAKRYASLRQVYYSLILAQWFKRKYNNAVIPAKAGIQNSIMSSKIDSKDLTNLTSKESWSKETYFQAYQKSFKDGEYNIKEPRYTSNGQVIRNYISGGTLLTGQVINNAISTLPSDGGVNSKTIQRNLVFQANILPNAQIQIATSALDERTDGGKLNQLRIQWKIKDIISRAEKGEGNFMGYNALNELLEIKDPEAIDELFKLLLNYGNVYSKDFTEEVSYYAITALNGINLVSPELFKDLALDRLIKYVSDSYEDTVAQRIAVLTIAEVKAERSFQALISLINRKEPVLNAIIGLGILGDSRGIDYLKSFLNSSDKEFRKRVTKSLQQIRNKLKSQLADKNVTLNNVQKNLRQADIEKVNGLLEEDGGFLTSKLSSIKIQYLVKQIEKNDVSAIMKLRKLNTPSVIMALTKLLKYKSNLSGKVIANVRDSAIIALSNIKTKESLEPLILLLQEKNKDTNLSLLIKVLSDVDDARVNEAFMSLVNDVDLRMEIILALRNTGGVNEANALIKLLENEDYNVRFASMQTLKYGILHRINVRLQLLKSNLFLLEKTNNFINKKKLSNDPAQNYYNALVIERQKKMLELLELQKKVIENALNNFYKQENIQTIKNIEDNKSKSLAILEIDKIENYSDDFQKQLRKKIGQVGPFKEFPGLFRIRLFDTQSENESLYIDKYGKAWKLVLTEATDDDDDANKYKISVEFRNGEVKDIIDSTDDFREIRQLPNGDILVFMFDSVSRINIDTTKIVWTLPLLNAGLKGFYIDVNQNVWVNYIGNTLVKFGVPSKENKNLKPIREQQLKEAFGAKKADEMKKYVLNYADGGKLDSIEAKGFAQEINYLMNMLGIKDYPRAIQIFKTAIDPVAFVKTLKSLSKSSSVDSVLKVMDNINYFKSIAANFRARQSNIQAPKSGNAENSGVFISNEGINKIDQNVYTPSKEIEDYLNLMHSDAANVPFVFRDNMLNFVGRFLGVEGVKAVENDLADILLNVENNFLSKVDLNKVKYIFTSGIGANEMYSHQLAYIVNQYLKSRAKKVEWIVVNNPAHLNKIPQEANSENTLVFEMSRSGSTKETIDFFNATSDRFKQRIVAANSGTLKSAAEKLSKDADSAVYIIDNTPGDIGGRQMNRKTLMTYLPLYLALAGGEKDINRARGLLKVYVNALMEANVRFNYAKGNSEAVELAQMLYRQRAGARNKFSVVYDETLKYSAKELSQLLNEGGNKIIAGGTNNNILDIYSLQADQDRYKVIFEKASQTQMPIFLLNRASQDYDKTLEYVRELNKKGIPAMVLTVDLTADIKMNLQSTAKLSALMQDMVVYFTYITNQDANSNPAVKLVREITAAIFDIVKDKKASGISDIRISVDDVLNKINQKQESEAKAAAETLDKKDVKISDYRSEFDAFVLAYDELAKKMNLNANEIVINLIRSTAKSVLMSDFGEAGGSKVSIIDEAFSRSDISEELGSFTAAQELQTLDKQVVLQKNSVMQVSVAVNKGSNVEFKNKDLAQNLADYFYSMYQDRKDKLMYMPLTYMEVDNDNKLISQIAQKIVDTFADKNITAPLLALPGVAHTGIEAIMSHPENVFNIAVVYTNTYGEGLGTREIEPGVTVDDATYVYGISNIVRMAKAGTPSIIFEVKNGEQLAEVQAVVNKTLELFRAKIDAEDGGETTLSLKNGKQVKMSVREVNLLTSDLKKLLSDGRTSRYYPGMVLSLILQKAVNPKISILIEASKIDSQMIWQSLEQQFVSRWWLAKDRQKQIQFLKDSYREVVLSSFQLENIKDENLVRNLWDIKDNEIIDWNKWEINFIDPVVLVNENEDGGGSWEDMRLTRIQSRNLWIGPGYAPNFEPGDKLFLDNLSRTGTNYQQQAARRLLDADFKAQQLNSVNKKKNLRLDDGGIFLYESQLFEILLRNENYSLAQGVPDLWDGDLEILEAAVREFHMESYRAQELIDGYLYPIRKIKRTDGKKTDDGGYYEDYDNDLIKRHLEKRKRRAIASGSSLRDIEDSPLYTLEYEKMLLKEKRDEIAYRRLDEGDSLSDIMNSLEYNNPYFTENDGGKKTITLKNKAVVNGSVREIKQIESGLHALIVANELSSNGLSAELILVLSKALNPKLNLENLSENLYSGQWWKIKTQLSGLKLFEVNGKKVMDFAKPFYSDVVLSSIELRKKGVESVKQPLWNFNSEQKIDWNEWSFSIVNPIFKTDGGQITDEQMKNFISSDSALGYFLALDFARNWKVERNPFSRGEIDQLRSRLSEITANQEKLNDADKQLLESVKNFLLRISYQLNTIGVGKEAISKNNLKDFCREYDKSGKSYSLFQGFVDVFFFKTKDIAKFSLQNSNFSYRLKNDLFFSLIRSGWQGLPKDLIGIEEIEKSAYEYLNTLKVIVESVGVKIEESDINKEILNPKDSTKGTVLVIENDFDFRAKLAQYYISKGFAVMAVGSLKEAWYSNLSPALYGNSKLPVLISINTNVSGYGNFRDSEEFLSKVNGANSSGKLISVVRVKRKTDFAQYLDELLPSLNMQMKKVLTANQIRNDGGDVTDQQVRKFIDDDLAVSYYLALNFMHSWITVRDPFSYTEIDHFRNLLSIVSDKKDLDVVKKSQEESIKTFLKRISYYLGILQIKNGRITKENLINFCNNYVYTENSFSIVQSFINIFYFKSTANITLIPQNSAFSHDFKNMIKNDLYEFQDDLSIEQIIERLDDPNGKKRIIAVKDFLMGLLSIAKNIGINPQIIFERTEVEKIVNPVVYSKGTVLVVEDDVQVRFAIANYYRGKGFSVVAVGSLKEAWGDQLFPALYGENVKLPVLISTDRDLGKEFQDLRNGEDLALKVVRGKEIGKGIPIVIISGGYETQGILKNGEDIIAYKIPKNEFAKYLDNLLPSFETNMKKVLAVNQIRTDGGNEPTEVTQLRWEMANRNVVRIVADLYNNGNENYVGRVTNILLDGAGVYWVNLDSGALIPMGAIKGVYADGGDKKENVGGIYFGNLPIVTQQAVSNLAIAGSGNKMFLMSKLEGIDLDQKIQELHKMVDAGITPSVEKIKEYVQATCLKDTDRAHLDLTVDCIAKIMQIDEENSRKTNPILKDMMLVLESGMAVKDLKKVLVGVGA